MFELGHSGALESTHRDYYIMEESVHLRELVTEGIVCKRPMREGFYFLSKFAESHLIACRILFNPTPVSLFSRDVPPEEKSLVELMLTLAQMGHLVMSSVVIFKFWQLSLVVGWSHSVSFYLRLG